MTSSRVVEPCLSLLLPCLLYALVTDGVDLRVGVRLGLNAWMRVMNIPVPSLSHALRRYESKLIAEREATLRLKGENILMKNKHEQLQQEILDKKDTIKHSPSVRRNLT